VGYREYSTLNPCLSQCFGGRGGLLPLGLDRGEAEAALTEAGAEGVSRKDLLRQVIARVNASERTALRALQGLQRRGMVEEEELPGKGRPKVLRLSGQSSPSYIGPLAQKGENVVQDDAGFWAKPLAQNGVLGPESSTPTTAGEGGSSGNPTPYPFPAHEGEHPQEEVELEVIEEW